MTRKGSLQRGGSSTSPSNASEREEGKFPAWMLCEDILEKAREELVSEAVRTLEAEEEAGRVSVAGGMVTAQEGMEDAERKLFIIGNIADRIGEISAAYHDYADRAANAAAGGAARIDDFRRFMLAASKIAMLVGYSRTLGGWIEDVGMHMKERTIREVLEGTLDSEDRLEALEFVVSGKETLFKGMFGDSELREMEGAVRSRHSVGAG